MIFLCSTDRLLCRSAARRVRALFAHRRSLLGSLFEVLLTDRRSLLAGR